MSTIRRATRILNCLPLPAWVSYGLIQVDGLAEGSQHKNQERYS